MHFWAIIMKRVRYFKRDIKGLMCEIFLPILIVVVGLLLMTIKFNVESPPLTLSLDTIPFKPS